MKNNTYWLNEKMQIIDNSEAWDEFATNNNGEACVSKKILNKPIWNFISGDTTKMWFETIIQYAKLKNEPITRTYRCDTPDIKRYMEMVITPEKDNILRIEHNIIGTEKRKHSVSFSSNSNQKFINRCSICGKIKHDLKWEEADSEIFQNQKDFNVIYCVCETCKSNIRTVDNR